LCCSCIRTILISVTLEPLFSTWSPMICNMILHWTLHWLSYAISMLLSPWNEREGECCETYPKKNLLCAAGDIKTLTPVWYFLSMQV
jgi:hypothetical protein